MHLLLHGRGNGVGALFFSNSPTFTYTDLPTSNLLPSLERDLLKAHQQAHGILLKTGSLPAQPENVLAGSFSIGGARAKAVMRSDDGNHWIAKFNQPEDDIDRIRAEHANLEMARAIGLHVPEVGVVDTEMGSVLLVKRFDRIQPSSNPDLNPDLNSTSNPTTMMPLRLHYVSAIALISAEPEDKRLVSARDLALFSYANIASVIRKVSPYPQEDRHALFAQMVLNICVHNTDDHLKNFGFLEPQAQAANAPRDYLRYRPVLILLPKPPGNITLA